MVTVKCKGSFLIYKRTQS
uniref:Uncharacterized protein n=1 Tax=Anguilla anguilla TaxID=7936 RepID=A0A0E9XUL2_ANGAN